MRFVHLLGLTLIGILSFGIYWASFAYFKSQEVETAAARLTLLRSTVEAELRHFAHMPFVLSLDPVIAEGLAGETAEDLDQRLARFAQSAGIEAIYLMDSTGLTIAASNARSESSFKGQNYAFRPYFQAALRGELGEFYGIGATTGVPGYFYAMSVRSSQSAVTGVVAIKIDLSALQDSWLASGERILLTNADGVVLLASDPAWRYRTLEPLTAQQRAEIVASRQFGQEDLAPLNWSVASGQDTVRLGDDWLLYLRTSDLPNSWSLHFLVPDDEAVTRASLVTGTMLFIVMLSFVGAQVNRVRRIGAALRKSEQEEALLRLANERLAVEIEERRLAEQNLKKTQADLERAGRLAALGRLAASVTHELGQPIAAMRNQLAASEMTGGATPLGEKMQGLVGRMENITTQLKFFSRKGKDKFEHLELRGVVDDALELLEPTIQRAAADVRVTEDGGNLGFVGNPLRIEQVVTNVVRNALDATEEAGLRRVDISMGGTAERVWFEVSDSGHGLGDKTFDDLREPFATTRESGRGMGLGLTISAGIVSDHGGSISALDGPMGGATFRIELPRTDEGRME